MSFKFNLLARNAGATIALLVLAALLTVTQALATAAEESFLPPAQAFKFSSQQLCNGTVALNWQIAPGYYLYQKRIKVTDAQNQPLAGCHFSDPGGR